jgi:hypothetical protein
MSALALLTKPALDPLLWLALRLAIAFELAIAADWLFLGPANVGLALPAFLLAVAAASLGLNPRRARGAQFSSAAAFLTLNVAMLAENVSPLSFFLGLFATVATAIYLTRPDATRWRELLLQALISPLLGLVRMPVDVSRALRLAGSRGKALEFAAPLAWLMPAALCGLFLHLFREANPLIADALALIDLSRLVDLPHGFHPLFWIVVVLFVWPLLHWRRLGLRFSVPRTAPSQEIPAVREGLFGAIAFERTLMALNALFACESLLDLVYLWGGAKLPKGMTYAEYAHRGAYPLALTASIAAAVVILATRPGGPATGSLIIRPLVLVFTAQNVLLVGAASFRLALYVEAYGLSELRLASFLWFALIAGGLASIVVQLLRAKSLDWLLGVNLVALLATLYLWCFLNVPAIVADYDVDHSFEATGRGAHLDVCYLQSLGPDVFPALDRIGDFATTPQIRHELAVLDETVGDWRSWSFRAWRLQRHLAARPSREGAASPRNCNDD